MKRLDDRIIIKNKFNKDGEKVIYWLSREHRVLYNPSHEYALKIAKENHKELEVLYVYKKDFMYASKTVMNFHKKVLESLKKQFNSIKIKFILIVGEPDREVVKFVKENSVFALITDLNPLKIKRDWDKEIEKNIDCSFIQVDSRNIVPVFKSSEKREYSAYTLRRKITPILNDYLPEDSSFKKENIIKDNELAHNIYKQLEEFIKNGIYLYNDKRNDPNANASSRFSHFLHFGTIYSGEIVREVKKSVSDDVSDSFIEEIFVRRELAENYCFYNEDYLDISTQYEWAQKTLKEHEKDKRDYIYSLEELENQKTHDKLWNKAQKNMIQNGYMHSYMRMYWAKKILEWSKDAKSAIAKAVYLNDKYFLDGRDPNGYTGIMWSICGLHDRAWKERPVFGKIRYMNLNGAKRKFDVSLYL
ncbi:MAG: deoxyribodipyrimidine photolyase [Candidatus Muiribacterium halophilum]|uniref:Deoxyribodipyrimidine photo-lyase n=1 Tax=Muiribacterium halophilum TaxID=2053465 RepID=A0A2N5ZLC0_MUIH1|nr:MAG: deoxyribodipyrimidine photolyase [Candidatus Muirbacterium halophilum]